MVLFVGVVAVSVVAADECPTRIGAAVGFGSVEQVAVKEQPVAWIQFAMDQFEPFFHLGHTIWISTDLRASRAVVDAH